MSEVIVEKSANDKREYKYFKLPNGVSALVISDPEISLEQHDDDHMEDEDDQSESEGKESGEDDEDEEASGDESEGKCGEGGVKKAAASVTVAIGSFSDPNDVQGLAHFVEHMLFMGSEAFPDENDYDDFLSKHGGYSNAFTECEYTTYFFSVNPSALEPSLHRLSNFFVSPLMKADAMDREVRAVHSEFTGVLQSDSCRLQQVQSHTSLPHHPLHNFTWGNQKSLVTDPADKGIDVRKRALELYNSYYVGPLMHVVVLGGEPISQLEQYVTDMFSKVRPGEGNVRAPTFESAGAPFQTQQLFILPSVKDKHLLSLTFELPPLLHHYPSQSEHYVSHVVGHEADGGLLPLLREGGWCTELVAGVSEDGFCHNSASSLFVIQVSLTDLGVAHLSTVLNITFAYLSMVRSEGPHQWIHDEKKQLSDIQFRYLQEKEADTYVSELSSSMPVVQPRHIVSHPFVHEEYNPALITSILKALVPENVRIDIVSSTAFAAPHPLGADHPLQLSETLTEPWFSVPYKACSLPAALVAEWAQSTIQSKNFPEWARPLAHIQHPNQFVPYDFELVNEPCIPEPKLLHEDTWHKLWHKPDPEFPTPRASFAVCLSNPAFFSTAEGLAVVELWNKLFSDQLNLVTYNAYLAGLDFRAGFSVSGCVEIIVSGFSHKLPELAIHVVKEILLPRLTIGKFEMFREDLVRTYANLLIKPTTHTNTLRIHLLRTHSFLPAERLTACKALTIERFSEVLQQLMGAVRAEAYMHGNVSEQRTVQVMQAVMAHLETIRTVSAPEPRILEPVRMIPEGVPFLFSEPCINAEEKNNAVQVYWQLGVETNQTRATIQLLEEMLGEPLFDSLRTKQQLGYTVSCGARFTFNIIGFVVVVQSAEYSCDHVISRIVAFMNEYAQTLKAMPAETFDKYKASLIENLQAKDSNMEAAARRYWAEILDCRYHFSIREKTVEAVEKLTKIQMLSLFDRIAHTSRQLRVCVYQSEGEPPSTKGLRVVDSAATCATWPCYQGVEKKIRK